MIQFLASLFKVALFTLFVLVLGQVVRWDGRTLSDQVKTTLASAERSKPLDQVRRKSSELVEESRRLVEDAGESLHEQALKHNPLKREEASLGGSGSPSSKIPHEEREELDSLLEEDEGRGETI